MRRAPLGVGPFAGTVRGVPAGAAARLCSCVLQQRFSDCRRDQLQAIATAGATMTAGGNRARQGSPKRETALQLNVILAHDKAGLHT